MPTARVVLLVADTRHSRRVIREFGELLSDRYRSGARELMAGAVAGRLPAASGCVVL